MVCKESVIEMSSVEFDEKLKNSTVVLIDVAGTTTAISFIKDTLFPYVIANVKSYLSENWDKESLTTILKQLREDCADLPKDGEKDSQIEKFAEYITKKTEEENDSTGIKAIQGLVYEHGYAKGDLKGHVFEDVANALSSWSEARKRRVCVYSTGSIESQKLLFGKSAAGDLTPHINTHFDQTVGPKTDATSYKNIATKLDCQPEAIVFLTDSVEEAKAASEAGVNAVLVSREGNTPITDEQKKLFPVVNSFKELPLNEITEVDSGKRKLPADEAVVEPPAKVAKTDETDRAAPETKEVTTDEKEAVSSTESKPAPTEEKKPAAAEAEADSNAMEGIEESPEKVEVAKTEEVNSSDDKKVEDVKKSDDAKVPESEAVTTTDTMEVDESPEETTNTEISTTSVKVPDEKKLTESKGTQVAIKLDNKDVASQAEIDKEEKKVESEAVAACKDKPEEASTEVANSSSDVKSSDEAKPEEPEAAEKPDTTTVTTTEDKPETNGTEEVASEKKEEVAKTESKETENVKTEETKSKDETETKQGDDKVDDKPKETETVETKTEAVDVKENGSGDKKEEAKEISEKTEQKTDDKEVKSNGANGVSSTDDVKNNQPEKNGDTNEKTEEDKSKNGVETSSTTNGDNAPAKNGDDSKTSTEIKVKTVSDVVGSETPGEDTAVQNKENGDDSKTSTEIKVKTVSDVVGSETPGEDTVVQNK